MPSTPLVALGMCTTGILRGVGDARRAMYVTLGAGLAAAIFDPILIFALDLGLDGAAISTVLARLVMLAIGIHGAHTVHGLVRLPDWRSAEGGGAAVLLDRAAGGADADRHAGRQRVRHRRNGSVWRPALAGWAIIGRIVPVAFGVFSHCLARSGRSSARISARGNSTASTRPCATA